MKKSNIHVCHIIIGLEKGGAETMLRRLIEENLASGPKFQHSVISLTRLGFHGVSLRQQGIEVYALNLSGVRGVVGQFWALIRLLRKIKPNVVQTWMVHADLLGGFAARIAGVPRIIWGVRTTDYSVESSSTRVVRWLCARFSSFVPDKIVCAAQASLESSVRAGYAVDKLMVIPNGFAVNVLRTQAGFGVAVRQQCGFDPEQVVVGCLGRYNPAKDHVNFVLAAGQLAARYPASRFLMIGRGLETGNAELMAIIRATGFSERFVLLGERTDPAACLAAMDVFVLSSCTEGFPNVLGEAMAMAVPCVSTDVGDAARLLGDCGEVVPPRNSQALAQAVARLLELSQAERQALGRRGQVRVEAEFSMAAAAQRFANLYETLLAKA